MGPQIFVTLSLSRIRIRIGLVPWIRIRICNLMPLWEQFLELVSVFKEPCKNFINFYLKLGRLKICASTESTDLVV